MIQTHYVPLERPYRVVYTGGVMGLQVGTLIVVQSEENVMMKGEAQIPTQSMRTSTHPVVSYVNKRKCDISLHISDTIYGGTYSEAVVWDKVDQSEVLTLCLEGQEMSWMDYLVILSNLISKCKDLNSTSTALREARRFISNLLNLGCSLQYPPCIKGSGLYEVDIDLCPLDYLGTEISQESYYCTGISDILPFAAPANNDEEAFRILERQYKFYKQILILIDPARKATIEFSCQPAEELPEYWKVKKIVDKLNLL